VLPGFLLYALSAHPSFLGSCRTASRASSIGVVPRQVFDNFVKPETAQRKDSDSSLSVGQP